MEHWSYFLFHTLAAESPSSQLVDIQKVFSSAPIIYSVLFFLSISSFVICLYTLATFRPKDILPRNFIEELRDHLQKRRFDEARELCTVNKLFGSIIATGLSNRRLGAEVMIESMKSEGKRVGSPIWQRLSLLNDIVIIAPMLGLLGTVIGMFYAFYDVNRSIESINALFDGLGIAVGTTVAGLIVAIIAMIFYTSLKYRITRTLAEVENEALALSPLLCEEFDVSPR